MSLGREHSIESPTSGRSSSPAAGWRPGRTSPEHRVLKPASIG